VGVGPQTYGGSLEYDRFEFRKPSSQHRTCPVVDPEDIVDVPEGVVCIVRGTGDTRPDDERFGASF
jgi:hypothetical protein